MLNLIASYWETERLFARDAVIGEDLDKLQALWESSAYIGEFDGHSERAEGDIYHDLIEGDLPPDGTKEFFKIQPLFSKENSEMIGYITMYHGYPDHESLWITFFYINSKEQGKGYGHEMIDKFIIEAEKARFQKIRLSVALKNWEAIRFWVKAGFDKITGFHGDKTYGMESFANLALEKSISKDK